MFKLDQKIDVGIGHSDFQAAPMPRGKELVTDWEKALVDARNGVNKRIKGSVEDLPNFHDEYETHIDLAADELQNNVFRMSLDFGRLCPKAGEFNDVLMARYIKMLAHCRKKKMEPLVTIHHWPMPLSFCEMEDGEMKKGGWEHPEILQHFKFYIDKIIEYFLNPDRIRAVLQEDGQMTEEEIDQIINEGIICKSFITINEPINSYLTPYIFGVFPPYKKGKFGLGKKVLGKVVEAHDIAYDKFHEAAAVSPEVSGVRNSVRLGVAHNLMHLEGKSWLTRLIAKYMDRKLNWEIVEPFEEKGSDFFGMQYYFRQEIGFNEICRKVTGKKPKGREYSDHKEFGDIYPEGIKKLLLKVNEKYPDKEVLVSEFGFADKEDKRRPFWIMETVKKILEAKEQGVKVTGVVLWSLINNLEWAEGMDMKFGLYDQYGRRLPGEEERISSRNVWAILSKYLNHPTEDNRAAVVALYEMAKAQHEQATKAQAA